MQEKRGHVRAVQSRGPPFKEGPGALYWRLPHILQPGAAGTDRSADFSPHQASEHTSE